MARSPGTEPTWVGNTPVRDDLHQQDSEGPYISLDGEHPEVDGLWSSPLDGELGPCQESALASGTAHSPPSSDGSPSCCGIFVPSVKMYCVFGVLKS